MSRTAVYGADGTADPGGSTMKVAQHRAERPETRAARVERACHDGNTSLSTIVLCIDFLAERSNAVGEEAVKGARVAIRRISTVMTTLREPVEPEASAPTTSAVFRKTDPPSTEGKRPSEPSGP
jgi:hypothetical protein